MCLLSLYAHTAHSKQYDMVLNAMFVGIQRDLRAGAPVMHFSDEITLVKMYNKRIFETEKYTTHIIYRKK